MNKWDDIARQRRLWDREASRYDKQMAFFERRFFGDARAWACGHASREGNAHGLTFPDASFDTVVCTFSLCNIPDERRAVTEMHRVLRPGGLLVLADHVASDRRLVLAGQWLFEKLTYWVAGDHQTRHPLPIVEQTGFVIEERQRYARGIVERLTARKPA